MPRPATGSPDLATARAALEELRRQRERLARWTRVFDDRLTRYMLTLDAWSAERPLTREERAERKRLLDAAAALER